MNKKNMFKIILDIVMTTIFLLLMNTSITGMNLHEILGLGILALFIIHNILNWAFTKNITKRIFNNGLRTRVKVMYVIDILLLLMMILMAVSGILISQTILTSISTNNVDFWTNLHISSAYIALILISIHIGMHWSSIMGAFRKMFKIKGNNQARKVILTLMSIMLVVNGLINIVKDDLLKKIIQTLFGGSSSINNNYNYDGGNGNNSGQFNNSNGDSNNGNSDDDSRQFNKGNRPGASGSQNGSSSDDGDSLYNRGFNSNDSGIQGKGNGNNGSGSNSNNGSGNSSNSINVTDMSYSNSNRQNKNAFDNQNKGSFGNNNDNNNSTITDSNDEGLQKYLGSLNCTGCGRHCPLTNPQCNTGVQLAQQAAEQYNSQSSTSVGSAASNAADFTNIINLLSVMSVFIAGTHYILRFNDTLAKQDMNK